MINYLQLNILDMLEFIGEDSCQNILSSFICPLNPDVEDFLHTKAIPFARQHIAVTYLVFAEQNNQKYLVGYYTLAIEHLTGGKTVYIECNNHPKLFAFYSSAGFFPFAERPRQATNNSNSDPFLVQMLKYFHH